MTEPTPVDKLHQEYLESTQMDVASMVIVHLALGKLTPEQRGRLQEARDMGASLSEIALALSETSGLDVTDGDVRVSSRCRDDSEYKDMLTPLLPTWWHRGESAVLHRVKDWASAMRWLYPDHPASKPLPRPEPGLGNIYLETLAAEGAKLGPGLPVRNYPWREPEAAGGFDGSGGFAEDKVYVAPVGTPFDSPGWIELGATENAALDAEESFTFTIKDMSPEAGALLYGGAWDQMGVTPEEDDPDDGDGPLGYEALPDEARDCGIPECTLCHPDRTGCQAAGCVCTIRDCYACGQGKHYGRDS